MGRALWDAMTTCSGFSIHFPDKNDLVVLDDPRGFAVSKCVSCAQVIVGHPLPVDGNPWHDIETLRSLTADRLWFGEPPLFMICEEPG